MFTIIGALATAAWVLSIINLIVTILDLIMTILQYSVIAHSLTATSYVKFYGMMHEPVDYLLNSVHEPGSSAQAAAQTVLNVTPTNLVETLYNSLVPVGLMLIFIFFAMRIVDIVLSDRVDVEVLLKTIMFAICGMLFLDSSLDVLRKVYEVICDPETGYVKEMDDAIASTVGVQSDSAFFALFSPNVLDADHILENMTKDRASEGQPSAFEDSEAMLNAEADSEQDTGSVAFCFVCPSFILMFPFMYLTYVFYMRAIKIAVNVIFAPIAFANLFGDAPNRSVGWAHFRRIIFLFLQGPVIIIMLRVITWFIVKAYDDFGLGMIGTCLFCAFLMIYQVGKSEQTIEEIISF